MGTARLLGYNTSSERLCRPPFAAADGPPLPLRGISPAKRGNYLKGKAWDFRMLLDPPFFCAHAAQAHPFPLQEKDAKVHLGGEAVYKTHMILMLLPLRTPSMHAIRLMACASLSYLTRSAQGRNPAPE